MDTKNDDSAGSDSLDKSLQKKCVVDDVGQGEGASGSDEKKPAEEASSTESAAVEKRLENSTKKQKTDKNVGDGSGGGASDSSSKAKTSEGAANSSTKATVQVASGLSSNASTSSSSASTATQPSNSNNAFETKVKQISKNLKETTLAESANKKTSLEDFNSTASSSSSSTSASSSSSTSASSSATSTPECEQPVGGPAGDVSLTDAVNSDDLAMAATCANPSQDGDISLLSSTNESIDEHDHRSKKVRFHPDVKENDGGNRVIPKKKKKLKSSHGGSGEESTTSGSQRGGADEEMELDEEEEIEEEEEFDLAKTIAEAQDYLKTHPLTFVRPFDKGSGKLQNGLLEEEDLPQLSESSEEEDVYENVAPENGIERILGKQIKCGKVEFLLRYAERTGLGWETEDVIAKQCPNLLNKYEQNRERRQERLMRHVAKRQNIRQRYTDF